MRARPNSRGFSTRSSQRCRSRGRSAADGESGMDTAAAVVVPAAELRALASEILRGMGSEEQEATEVADHLVEANLKGHDSHGIGMIPHYMSNFHAGKLHPNKHARLVRHDGAFAVFDGDMG